MSVSRTRTRAWLVVGLAALLTIGSASMARADELSVVSAQALSSRLTEYTFASTAMGGQTKARVLLPAGYDASVNRRYPVLHRSTRPTTTMSCCRGPTPRCARSPRGPAVRSPVCRWAASAR